MVLEQQPVIPLMSVLDQQGTMAKYSAGNGLELAGLSLPTSCLKVPLEFKDIKMKVTWDRASSAQPLPVSSILYHVRHSLALCDIEGAAK